MASHMCNCTRYRCPLIIIAVGLGFALVGAIPVAVNFSTGATNSGTIIGVGFIGFGLLLVVPGLCWCLVQRLMELKRDCKFCCCCCKSSQDIQETIPALDPRPSKRSTIDMSSSSANNDYDNYDEEDERGIADDNGTSFVVVIPGPQKNDCFTR